MTCKYILSPTSINLYRRCPKAFYFYINKYPEIPSPFKEALVFGQLVHKIIAHYYELIPKDVVPGEVKVWVRKAMTDLWHPEYEAFRNRIENQLITFIKFEERRLSWHVNPKPIAVEKEFRRNCVHGIVDAIFRMDDKTIIVDWKTGRGYADLTDDIIIQLNTYLWLTGADEAYVLFLEYNNFRKLTSSVNIEELVNQILSDDKYPSIRGSQCKFCPYQIACLMYRGEMKYDTFWWIY